MVKIDVNLVPTVVRAVIATTATKAAIKAYSIMVTPFCDLVEKILFIIVFIMVSPHNYYFDSFR